MSKDALAYLNDRLKALGCDPIEFAANAMTGFVEGSNFPVLEQLIEFFDAIEAVNPDEPPAWGEIKRVAAHLHKVCVDQLSDTYVPLETRIRICLELLNYQYPKRKAIDYTDTGVDAGKALANLPDDKLLAVLKKALEGSDDKTRKELLKAMENLPPSVPLPSSMH